MSENPAANPTTGPSGEPVGSLAAEAARFVGAFTSWAAEHGAEVTHQAADLAGHLRDQTRERFADGSDASEGSVASDDDPTDAPHSHHTGTDGAPCTACPVCRTMTAVREVSPELKAHLATAATSLVAAASTLLATVVDAGRHPEADPDTDDA